MILERLNTSICPPTGSIKGSILGKFSGCYLARCSQNFTYQEKKEPICEELQHSGRWGGWWARVSEADLEAATFNRTSTNEHQRACLES